MNDRGRAVVAELQQDELPSVGVHGKRDHRQRRGRTPVEEERERGSQNDLSHRPVPMRMKRKENKHRSSSQSSSRGITPDPQVKRFNPQTDGLAALYHCLIRLYKTSSDGTITWNDLRSLYRKDVGRSFNTEELNLICGTTRRTKHQLLQTKLNKLIEPMDTKGLILRIVHTDEGVPVPLPSPIASSDDDASLTLSRMTSTEDEEFNKLSMEERRRELTESLIKQGLLKKSGERMSASYDSPVEETEASIHVEKVDESEISETEVRERVFNSLMKNFAQIEELEKTLEETDAIQERLEKTLAETNEVEAYIEARRSPSPTASCHTITEEDVDEEEPATLSPKRSSIKKKKINGFSISEEQEEIAQPVEIAVTVESVESNETPVDSVDKEQTDQEFHIPVYFEELSEEEKIAEEEKMEEDVGVKEEITENEPATDYSAEMSHPIKIPTISVTEYFEENTENPYPEDEMYEVEYEESATDGREGDYMPEEDIWNEENTDQGEYEDYVDKPQNDQGKDMPYEPNHNWEELTKNPFIEEQLERVELKEQDDEDESQKERGRESPEYDNWRETDNEFTEDSHEDEKIDVPVELGQIKEETIEETTEEISKQKEEKDAVNKTDEEEHPLPPQPTPRRSLETSDNAQVNIEDEEKEDQTEADNKKEKFLDHVNSTEVFAELPAAPVLYYAEQTPSPSSPPASHPVDDLFGDFEFIRKASKKKEEKEEEGEIKGEAPEENKEIGGHGDNGLTVDEVQMTAAIDKPEVTENGEWKDDKVEKAIVEKPEKAEAGSSDIKETPVEVSTEAGHGERRLADDEVQEMTTALDKSKVIENDQKNREVEKEVAEKKNIEKPEKTEAGPSHKVEYVPYAITKKTTYNMVEQQKTRTITVCQTLPPQNPTPSAVQDEELTPEDRQPVPVHKTSTIEVELAQSEEDTFGFLESLPSTSRTNKVADVHVADVHIASLSPSRDLEKRDMTVTPVKRKKRWFCRGFCCFC